MLPISHNVYYMIQGRCQWNLQTYRGTKGSNSCLKYESTFFGSGLTDLHLEKELRWAGRQWRNGEVGKGQHAQMHFCFCVFWWHLVTVNKTKQTYQSCWECCWSCWDNNSLPPIRFCCHRWRWSVCRSQPPCWCWEKKPQKTDWRLVSGWKHKLSDCFLLCF